MLTGHGALRYGTSMWAVMWSCAAMAVDSTLSWLYRSQYVALVAPTSCFGVAVMSESEYMQKIPQEKLLLVIRATFFPKSAKQPNVKNCCASKSCEEQDSQTRANTPNQRGATRLGTTECPHERWTLVAASSRRSFRG